MKNHPFYETCDSETDLMEFLDTAPLEDLRGLLDTIIYRYKNDDLYSPLMEYKDEIREAINTRLTVKSHT